VREIALQHGAQWRLQSPVQEGRGLAIRLSFVSEMPAGI
jgi:hypothetical protein